MECRIESKSDASRTVVTITGRLSGQVTEELRGVRRSIEGAVILDLAGLVSADDEGVEAILLAASSRVCRSSRRRDALQKTSRLSRAVPVFMTAVRGQSSAATRWRSRHFTRSSRRQGGKENRV